MIPFTAVTIIVLITVAGDYFLKLSSGHESWFGRWEFWCGALLYMVTAIGWTVAMRHMSLASIGVYYAILTMVLLTALGTLVFEEAITAREGTGILLAMVSLVLMASRA